MKKINHWINGKNVAGADYFHTTNPATGEVLAEVASGTPKGLSDVVPGDEVIVEVEGVGRLVNHIISQQAYEETLS